MESAGSRALAIVRVSTVEQAHEERYSIPHQRTHITEECRHRGLDLVHFFEFVQSGAKVLSDTGKEKAEVIKFIKDYDINTVIVHELDRLARSMLDTLLFVDQLDKLGVSFVSIHDGFDTTTPQGQLQMHILSAFSEYFRKQLASKVIGGMVERAKQGKHMGRRPLGYRIGLAGFEVDKEEAKIIRLIFVMYLEQNLGLRGIADHLNTMGLKSLRGNVWSHVSVREIIENEVYTGTFIWGDVRVENNHPSIVDRKIWEKAQARRKRKNELGGRAQNSFYLLSGLLRCGTCNDSTMVGRLARKGDKQYRYYTCNNYASKGLQVCSSGYTRADELEEAVVDAVRRFSENPIVFKHEMIPSNKTLILEQIDLKKKELSTLNMMLNRAAEAYEKGMYDLEWFSMRRAKILDDRAAVESELTTLEGQSNGTIPPDEMERLVTDRVSIAKQFLDETDQPKSKAILQNLINNIVVYSQHNIQIFYRF